LAVLLGSYFLYNSIGAVDESALDRLSLVAEISAMLQKKSGSVAKNTQAGIVPKV
jgi:hypothetical protein